jgi:hypothetical protein
MYIVIFKRDLICNMYNSVLIMSTAPCSSTALATLWVSLVWALPSAPGWWKCRSVVVCMVALVLRGMGRPNPAWKAREGA